MSTKPDSDNDRLIDPHALASWVAQAQRVRQQRAAEQGREAVAIRAGAVRGEGKQDQPAGRRA